MFRPRSASPGERIIRHGDRADAMYFIASGGVEVRLNNREIRLEAGDFFGEMALLTGERRTADVIAIDFCQLLVLSRRDFNQFMARHPAVRAVVANVAQVGIRFNAARLTLDFERIAPSMDRFLGWSKTVGGLAQVEVRGLAKVRAVFVFGVAAYNLVRLPKLLASTGEVRPAA